jgi:quercetin dioxygenase-like cupin family protein
MATRFRIASETRPERMPWGLLSWLSNPPSTGAKQLAVVEGTFAPSQGHSFHQHPHQEEVIYVLAGTIEQWIDREKRLLGPGDSVFIPAGVVHASFDTGPGDSKLIAVFGPCVGETGMETMEVAGEAPWNQLRG